MSWYVYCGSCQLRNGIEWIIVLVDKGWEVILDFWGGSGAWENRGGRNAGKGQMERCLPVDLFGRQVEQRFAVDDGGVVDEDCRCAELFHSSNEVEAISMDALYQQNIFHFHYQ